MAKSKTKSIGILTSGGDCPGLNAAIRGVAKAAKSVFGMEVIGILDGFTGLIENRIIPLADRELTGLLTMGGTILGTSRNKPHKMPMPDGSTRDMTGAAIETYRRLNLDCLVCIGGGGTAKNAYHLMQEGGMNVITLPKTIDNDVAETDVTFGYDSAMTIATEAIDRLHTTASSHQRVMLIDVMGHNAGWLALGASLASGTDVCLIPEIPFHVNSIIETVRERQTKGRRFSLISVAEGAVPAADSGWEDDDDKKGESDDSDLDSNGSLPRPKNLSGKLAGRIKDALNIETRVTTLGHIQRGGIPTPTDRILATQLGVKAAQLIEDEHYGVMVGVKGQDIVPVPLKDVAGKKKTVPLDHPLIKTARLIDLSLGD